jgi:hypothetical protein
LGHKPFLDLVIFWQIGQGIFFAVGLSWTFGFFKMGNPSSGGCQYPQIPVSASPKKMSKKLDNKI